MHPSREVGRFDTENLSSRPGDCRRYPTCPNEKPTVKFSVRSLFLATAAIAGLIALAMEYGSAIRADGGGDQLITLTCIPSTIKNIEFVPVHSSQLPDYVAKAFSSGDRTDLYQYVDPTQINTVKPTGANAEISIRQQWSFTEMGLTKRRPHYTQTYRHLVLNLMSTDGASKQYTIDLPEYCKTTTIDLSRDERN